MHPTQDVLAARAFAITAHGDQRYGTEPYIVHLDEVARLARPYGEFAEMLAYLHDTLEDTGETLDDVTARFGPTAAACVDLLKDSEGGSRRERKAATYARMAAASMPLEPALLVKTADRLANVTACINGGHASLLKAYRSEHAAFKAAAYRPGLCDELWDRLDRLINAALSPDTVAREVQSYLHWFEQLIESRAPARLVVSRHYASQHLNAYARYSLSKLAVAGAPSMCIADITVEPAGCGLFTQLFERFVARDWPLPVNHLFVENVSNARFAAWLERRGFSACPYGDPLQPTLFFERGA